MPPIQKDIQKDFQRDMDVNKDLQTDIRRDVHSNIHSSIHRDFHRDIHKEMLSKPVICLENALRFDSQALGDVQNGNPNVDLQWPYVEPHYVEPCYGSTEPAPAPSAVPTVPAPYEPAPGSTELPSVGSRGHYSGDCKPCSFLYAKGCNNGAMCLFCHLCDRSEKKRRQKAKRAALKGGA